MGVCFEQTTTCCCPFSWRWRLRSDGGSLLWLSCSAVLVGLRLPGEFMNRPLVDLAADAAAAAEEEEEEGQHWRAQCSPVTACVIAENISG